MKSEFTQASFQPLGNRKVQHAGRGQQNKEIARLKRETQLLELLAYSLLSMVGVIALFASLGVDFGTSFDKAPLALLFTCCTALTYMTRKNRLARLEAAQAEDRSGNDESSGTQR